MNQYRGSILGRVLLRFDLESSYARSDLSCAARAFDGTLVAASDERASLELLTPRETQHVFVQERSVGLAPQLGLADDDEIDLEGLALSPDGQALYLCGSHSAKRKKPRGKDDEEDLTRLASVKVDPARFVLARAPLEGGSLPEGDLSLSVLPSEGDYALLSVLARDPHLGPYLPVDRHDRIPVPGKDNGFDIEGLAVMEDRLLLGLRGPVLRGWAFILELEPTVVGPTLGLDGGGKARFRKHALDLDGLGVRELAVHGDDLLILAGPTMTLDGAHRLFRWCGGPRKKRDTVNRQEKGVLEPLFDLPFAPGHDRAEGLTVHSWFDDADSVLVLYDSPSPARRRTERAVLADVFAL